MTGACHQFCYTSAAWSLSNNVQTGVLVFWISFGLSCRFGISVVWCFYLNLNK